jgi:folate-binding protein YgfZ
MCTNEVKKLRPGQGCMAAVVNRQGKMIAEIVVRATADALVVEVDRSNLPATMEALAKFVVADDVAFTPRDWKVFGVFGPEAASSLPLFHFMQVGEGLVSPVPLLAGGGWVRLGPGAPIVEGSIPLSEAEFEELRISNGFPRWGIDMGPELLPMEAGLEPLAVSYEKGCYIGQEVIQRVKTYSEPPRMLVRIDVAGAKAGDPVVLGAEEAGRVGSAARACALAVVRKEARAPGTKVAVGGREGVVRALPWHEALQRPR